MPANVVVLLVVLALATLVGVLVRRHNGHFRGAPRAGERASDASHAGLAASSSGDPAVTPAPDRETIDPGDLPAPLGERATLLQFSSAFCAPCRATRRVLAEVADVVPGVQHVEIDAEQNLDLVRRLGVLRTPTTFVLDASGAVVTRASGAPRKVDVIAALGRVVEGEPRRPTE